MLGDISLKVKNGLLGGSPEVWAYNASEGDGAFDCRKPIYTQIKRFNYNYAVISNDTKDLWVIFMSPATHLFLFFLSVASFSVKY